MIRGIIFELEDVLVNTDRFHYEAWKTLTNKEGIPFNKEVYQRLNKDHTRESLEIVLDNASVEYTPKEKETLIKLKDEYYIRLLEIISPEQLIPDVKIVLEKLLQHNYKIAIASNHKSAKRILKQVGLIDLFKVIDGNDIRKNEPHPEILMKTCHKLKLKPEECVFIANTESGIKTAKNAGILAIGMGHAHKSSICDDKIEELNELLDILKIDKA